MKRSEINKAIKDMEGFLEENKVKLPPFAYWSPDDWQEKDSEYEEIKDSMLGWDITDAGLGDFKNIGFSLFTVRNGNLHDERYQKTYAEKYIYIKENQTFPFHFHWYKTEDIINRAGGTLIITVYNDDGNGEFSDEDVVVNSDGRSYSVKAGSQVELEPGESITLWSHQYHHFSVKEGTGDVLVGEISMTNDDKVDNRFYEDIGRFPDIIEDEEPYRLLCTEYPREQTKTL